MIIYPLYKWTWDIPKDYGPFHLYYFFGIPVVVLICALLMRKRSDIVIRIFILLCTCIMLIMEVIKQNLCSFNYNEVTGVVTWIYKYGCFPFQLCSTTMYMSLLTSLIWKGRIQKMLDATIVISMIGATTDLFYPSLAFVNSIFLCNQSMIYHGLMMAIGVVLMITRLELNHKTFFLYGVPLYLVLVMIALIMDICFYYFYSRIITFNMFFISPFWDGVFPVIGPLRIKAYPVYLLIYIVMSTFYGYLLFFVGMITKYIFNKIHTCLKKKRKKQDDLKKQCLYKYLLYVFSLVLSEDDYENELNETESGLCDENKTHERKDGIIINNHI
jgi:hypothetical protein